MKGHMSAHATKTQPEYIAHTARAALAFLHDSGVDIFVSDSPRNWLAVPAPILQAPAPVMPAEQVKLTKAVRAVTQVISDDLAALAAEVAAFTHPLNPGGASRPCLLQGPEGAAVLLLTETGLSQDSDIARLISAMMAAIGLSMENIAWVPLLPWPTSGGRAARPEELADFAPFARVAVRLARPLLVLALGPHLAGPLLSATSRPGDWHELGEVPMLTTLSPALLLRSPGLKAEAWAHLQAMAKRLT